MEGIDEAVERSLRDVQGNESLTEKLRDTKRLAFRLATQITNCPKRSTFPRQILDFAASRTISKQDDFGP